MDIILSKLRSAKYITTIDHSKAFQQIPLARNSREYTAFTVPGRGSFQYKTMPCGLSSFKERSPGTGGLFEIALKNRAVNTATTHDLTFCIGERTGKGVPRFEECFDDRPNPDMPRF